MLGEEGHNPFAHRVWVNDELLDDLTISSNILAMHIRTRQSFLGVARRIRWEGILVSATT